MEEPAHEVKKLAGHGAPDDVMLEVVAGVPVPVHVAAADEAHEKNNREVAAVPRAKEAIFALCCSCGSGAALTIIIIILLVII